MFWCISVSSGRPVPAVAGRVGTVVRDLKDKNVEDLPKVAQCSWKTRTMGVGIAEIHWNAKSIQARWRITRRHLFRNSRKSIMKLILYSIYINILQASSIYAQATPVGQCCREQVQNGKETALRSTKYLIWEGEWSRSKLFVAYLFRIKSSNVQRSQDNELSVKIRDLLSQVDKPLGFFAPAPGRRYRQGTFVRSPASEWRNSTEQTEELRNSC